jgi:hypothetical protein
MKLVQPSAQDLGKCTNGRCVVGDGELQGLHGGASVQTVVRGGVIVRDAHVEQLLELRQRGEQGDRHVAPSLTERVLRVATGRAMQLARHALGERAKEALDERPNGGLADRPGFKPAPDEAAEGLEGVFGQMRGRVVDLQHVPARVVQLGQDVGDKSGTGSVGHAGDHEFLALEPRAQCVLQRGQHVVVVVLRRWHKLPTKNDPGAYVDEGNDEQTLALDVHAHARGVDVPYA